MELKGLTFRMEEDILTADITHVNGSTQSLTLVLRSEGGQGYEE